VPSRLSPEQEAEVAGWIRRGPDVEVDGVVRWRCVDIQARIGREWGAALHKRSVAKLLHRLRFARVSTRPRHPKADPAVQASFVPSSLPL
jgi:transposase